MKKLLLVLLAIVLIGGGIWLLFLNNRSDETPATETQVTNQNDEPTNQEPSNTEQETSEESDGQAVQVSYTDSGFEPAEITINAGDTVVWTNNSNRAMHIASDDHPEHTDYPGFDQLSAGQSYSFTFTEVGTWGYHNHENHTDTGLITVN